MIYAVDVTVEIEAKTPEEAEDSVLEYLADFPGVYVVSKGVEALPTTERA